MNPFANVLATAGCSETDLYSRNRDERQAAQKSLLFAEARFNRDETLARLASDATFNDPRHSIIFIARPKHLASRITLLQDAIIAIFERHGISASKLWKTPAQDLHMTILDIISCVSQETVNVLKAKVSGQLTRAICGTCTLSHSKVMVDGNAMALSFLPVGRTIEQDSHLNMRRDLWQACRDNQTTPIMRYIAHSAHVTLIRFLDDIVVSQAVMAKILQEIESLDLVGLDEWQITRADVKCVYGQVYYGGGTIIP